MCIVHGAAMHSAAGRILLCYTWRGYAQRGRVRCRMQPAAAGQAHRFVSAPPLKSQTGFSAAEKSASTSGDFTPADSNPAEKEKKKHAAVRAAVKNVKKKQI